MVSKILRYIKHSPSSDLFFSGSITFGIEAFSDSDWASCPITRRSTIGFAIYLHGNIISWQTRKQYTVARSSTEVEYRALTYTSCEVTWLTNLLKEVKINTMTLVIFTNNTSTTTITKNPISHQRTKYIEISIHTIRDKVLAKEILLNKIDTKLNVVNIFTTIVTGTLFLNLRKDLEM